LRDPPWLQAVTRDRATEPAPVQQSTDVASASPLSVVPDHAVLRLQAAAGNQATVAALNRTASSDLIIRREYVASWDEVTAKLTDKAKLGLSQFVTLNGEQAAEAIKKGSIVKDGDKAGKYDTDKAEGIWSKKVMEATAFDEALARKKTKDSGDVKSTLATMNHLCNETDGTHRPGSVGDGSSEWALKWEAEHGEPFRSPSGHAIKLRDYCKVLSEGLAAVASKKGSVASTETMSWTEKKGAATEDVNVLTQLGLVVARATERLTKMREGVAIWNARIATYPAMWNVNGTSKVTPPGVEALANGQLKAGWPKEKTVQAY
jgi:hypothetical protein